MKSGQRPATQYARLLLIGLLAVSTQRVSAFDEDDPGWSPHDFKESAPWQEVDSGLPAYPQEENLIAFGNPAARGGNRLYVDPRAIAVGADQVVRYTVVIVSATGVWNVSHEGLHCGNKAYRRLAYGIDGKWHELADSPWLPLDGGGIFAYRRLFYLDYMCSPAGPYLQPEQIIRKFRSHRMQIGE